MAHHDSDRDRPGRVLNVEVPGDTDAADIVGRTGEQMPRQAHDGVTDDNRERSTRVNDEEPRKAPAHQTGLTNPDRHDNPRTGRVSDW